MTLIALYRTLYVLAGITLAAIAAGIASGLFE
jgi:hypothetical protein